MSFGFRIGRDRPQVDVALVEKFRAIPVACISDVMNRIMAGGARLRPVGMPNLSGPAITVKAPPGDNLMTHKAIELAKPGSVIVVDAGGDLTNAIIGERMYGRAVKRGIAGFVVNGAVRDVAALKAGPIPVFAAGVTHRGPYKNGPGEINYPIAIEGMVIESGDLIVGDADGLLCVPIRDAAQIFVAAAAKAEKERLTANADGDSAWVDAALKKFGCEFVDGSGDATSVRVRETGFAD